MARFVASVILVLATIPVLALTIVIVDVPEIPEPASEVAFPAYDNVPALRLSAPPSPVVFECGFAFDSTQSEPIPIATLTKAKLVYFHSEQIFGRNPWMRVHTLKIH